MVVMVQRELQNSPEDEFRRVSVAISPTQMLYRFVSVLLSATEMSYRFVSVVFPTASISCRYNKTVSKIDETTERLAFAQSPPQLMQNPIFQIESLFATFCYRMLRVIRDQNLERKLQEQHIAIITDFDSFESIVAKFCLFLAPILDYLLYVTS